MADDGTGRDDDLWADTRPEGATGSDQPTEPVPPIDPDQGPLPPPEPDQTTAMPPTGPDETTPMPPTDPTTVQPTTPGATAAAGMGAAAGAAGASGPGGGPPPVTPGDEFPLEEPSGRPPWLLPAAIGLLVVLVIGLIAVLASGDDDDATDSTTTSSGVSTSSTEPLFVPGSDLTTSVASTSTTPATTTGPGTTAQPTTAPPVTDPPPTDPPPTEPPPTDPPPTDPPPTDPPVLPDPGVASIDGQDLQISVACLTVPSAGSDLTIASYLVDGPSGRTVIERWFGAGSNGVDVELVDAGQRASSTDATGDAADAAFTTTVQGDVTLEIALNPPSGGVPTCPDFIETTNADGGDARVYSVLAVCSNGGGVNAAAIASEGGAFEASDNGDGTATVQFTDRDLPVLTDPAALASIEDTVVTYLATATGDGQTRNILGELELADPPPC